MTKNMWLLSGALIAAFTASTAYAQEGASDSDEIIVTAQKREQSIQNVPLAVTAFSGETLQELGVQSMTDVVAQVPNVSFQAPFGDSGAPVFNIRGVSTIDFGDSNEPSVSVYMDDIYVGTPAGQSLQLFDMRRVEVLRGPQGTLYGRNATGGLVHFISNTPTDDFYANIQAQLGSYDQRVLEAAISGPLAEGVRARVAGKLNQDDGWQQNVVNGGRFNVMDAYALRGMVEVDVGSSGQILAQVHHSEQSGTYTGYGFFGTADPISGAPCSPERILNSECVNSSGFRDPDPRPGRIISTESSLPNNAEVTGGGIRFSWDFGNAELTSITGYENIQRFVTEDAAAAVVTPFPLLVTYTTDNSQFSQELRLAGDTERFSWLAGAYYYADERFVTNALPTFDLFDFADLNTDTWAVFGQGTYALSDTLSVTAGARYTSEERTLERLAAATGGAPNTRQGIPFFETSGNISINRVTGRLGLEWAPNADVLAYGSVSTGFKSGGFNTILVASQAEVGPVDAEEIVAYELGFKSRFWDRRGTFNIAAFLYDYSSIQTVGSTASGGGVPAARFINAGDAEVLGAEAELSLQLNQNWRVDVGVGVLDTQIIADPSVTFNGAVLNGNRLLQAPSFNANGRLRYELPTSFGQFAAQADFSYQTKVFFGPDNQPTESQDAYGLLNLRLTWESLNSAYRIEAFGENILDEEYFLYGADIAGINESVVVVWGRPATYGLRLTREFN